MTELIITKIKAIIIVIFYDGIYFFCGTDRWSLKLKS